MPDIFLPPHQRGPVCAQLSQDIIDYGIKMTGADKIWGRYTGSRVKLAIMDTGIDTTHIDLKNNIRSIASFVPGESVEDTNGHGTHVAGIAGGIRNGIGIVGVAPGVNLYPVKVLDKTGNGFYPWIVKGIEWCIQQGVHIINMSLGGFDVPNFVKEAFEKAHRAGILLVVAGGNEGKSKYSNNTLSGFAQYPFTISVGAIGPDKTVAEFSSVGKPLNYVAAGVNIYSCYPKNKYTNMSGTSMAAPAVAGKLALLLDKALDETGQVPSFESVLKQFNAMTEDIGAEGFDIESGNGHIRIDKLLEETTPPVARLFWRVQVGAYGSLANAIIRRDEIITKGHAAIIKHIHGLYKVQTGAFSEEWRAQNALKTIKELGYEDAFVVYY